MWIKSRQGNIAGKIQILKRIDVIGSFDKRQPLLVSPIIIIWVIPQRDADNSIWHAEDIVAPAPLMVGI